VEIIVYVSNQSDVEAAQAALAYLDGAKNVVARVVDLYGSELSGVPGVVLQVMRIKRTGALPLTVVDGQPMVSGTLPTSAELDSIAGGEAITPAALVDHADSAVHFATASRMHVSMFVNDLAETVKFYEVFFGQPATKHLADYAKFEVAEPPLVVSFNPDRKPSAGGAVNHLGIQVKSTDVVMRMKERFERAGFITDEELACGWATLTATGGRCTS
jgi:extradiol dioxygenase family protein